MKKTYNPSEIERDCYQRWEEASHFKAKGEGEPYCIILPPPNVTGTLHMGHGFQLTLMDALIRYHRMRGFNTLWQAGTDHAGIATQMVVERRLAKEGVSRHDLGRDAFVQKVWDWKAHSGKTIKNQIRRMGASLDWDRECFTLDDHVVHAVKKVFIELYQEGLIYRGKRLVNWDPVFCSAISDLEVINKEVKGHLWHIKYPLADRSGELVVATTRPETMLGDTAVAVHPDDERYKALVGKMVKLPLTDREIPIIADEYVDPEFGSGCVKITPGHDFNDYDVGKRHDLPIINVLTPDGKINDEAPEAYRDLDRFIARKHIVRDLEAQGLLDKTDDHVLQVPHGDRSGAVIEPYLTDQWYVACKPLAEEAIKTVKKGDIQFVPDNWNKTYYQWLDNIEDWCISRQLWWGHRIPAWYDETGNVYVGFDEEDVRAKNNLDDDVALSQDEDVLDTWFSSALWPFVTLGWPEETAELQSFYPTSVLVTGFDIIFFWVARMIMMGLKFTDKVPFDKVYITGLIRDSEGQKMSKSKGNILDPLDLIDGIDVDSLVEKRTAALMQDQYIKKVEKHTRKEFPDGIPAYGADPVRFTFAALATNGRDVRFDLGRVEGYRNFCNKLWNATRFVLMTIENQNINVWNGKAKFSVCDRWIQSRLQNLIEETHTHYKEYRFDLLAHAIYEFIWNEYCDWYVELSKISIKEGDEAAIRGTCQTLLTVLDQCLRITHPLMPFITEAIWQQVAPIANVQGESIMVSAYPDIDSKKQDKTACDDIRWLKNIITSIRTIRSEMNISPAKTIPLLLRKGNLADHERIEQFSNYLKTLAKIESVENIDNQEPPASATAIVDTLELLVPMAGLIDKEAELARLEKTIIKLQKDFDRSNNKLNNPNYVNNAPAEVVEQEKSRLADSEAQLEKLKAQLDHIQSL